MAQRLNELGNSSFNNRFAYTMRALAYCLVAGALLTTAAAFALFQADAAQNPATERFSATSTELLVFEASNCAYCFVFRRDVAPGYLESPRAKRVPLRYVDIGQADMSKIHLNTPLTMLPTVVLMRNGREIDRISGYMGPEPFYYMISRLMK